MSEQQKSSFFRTYDLTKTQKQPKEPAAHQIEALGKLQKWFQEKHSDAGGILVLPTGGGKTLTAVRFLCTEALSDGYKVLWLAHTHHLLEQAFESLESEVKLIQNKQQLSVRVVSGTKGHFTPAHINKSDDVLICTLQTITRAYENKVPQLDNFLQAAGDKLFVVFDEAHHSPAPSYCKLINALRDRCPKMYLLGLTATPTHTDEKKRGWLTKLFPQRILFQSSPQDLMAAEILARPIFEQCHTNFTPEFDESKYQKWVKDFQDLPEEIITKLAENQERNAFIAKTYADNQARYGKTIIFADRWFQCEQLRGFLEQQKKGIRVGTIYSHIDADPGSADARNKRNRDENAKVLDAFRNDQLDVVINVRMLTEGTDVPKLNTVFLTRQTRSEILLTQMVGRALRGPKFGGTDDAYIVSFIDNWENSILWAISELVVIPIIEPGPLPVDIERVAIQLISIDLVRQLVRQMDSGVNINPAPFLTFMPIGWYRVELETPRDESGSTVVQRLVMVFENEKDSYKRFIEYLKTIKLDEFVEANVFFNNQQQRIQEWQSQFFDNVEKHIGSDLLANLFQITQHIAQNDGEAPNWFGFEQRNEHNLDDLAHNFLHTNGWEEDDKLRKEYNRKDRYWKILYYNYNLFKSQYNACAEWILAQRNGVNNLEVDRVISIYPPDPEPSDEIKLQVKQRDGFRCLCCSENKKSLLQIDHIKPKYYGGDHSLDNLQTLCRTCNKLKGIEHIDFRLHKTRLTTPNLKLPTLEFPTSSYLDGIKQWEQFLRRRVNFFYSCDAVKFVDVGEENKCYHYQWQICLYEGNNPDWLESNLQDFFKKEIRQVRKKAGFSSPESIIINAAVEGRKS